MYHFYELSQWFNLEAPLQTNDVTESDVKEVIKKQLENSPKRKGSEKTRMMWMIRLIRPMLIQILNSIVGIILY